MTKTMKQSIAIIAVIAQLLILLPFTIIPVNAEESAIIDNNQPVLNKTIVGSVTFQSFNFLGDNETGEDGTEYNTTFYYTDDFFSSSAVNESVTSTTQKWNQLDNVALATCSMDFTVAAMTSSKKNVNGISARSWENTTYDVDKAKNAYSFLSQCGFTNNKEYELSKKPTMDSIGCTIGSKKIVVWDERTNSNKEFTVVAVGIRGAGYDSEWASNITIGDKTTNALPANGRHYGFDSSAQEVCRRIKEYIDDYSIDSDVKYWITGFSRAAAVANLAAGYLTDDTENKYHTSIDDVYGYTWECPQAASKDENALKYKNIHNIINPMDAVPKVSPSEFEHQRLGVDYEMPYHGNTDSTTENGTLYQQMFEVLKTIAIGNGIVPDPLVDDAGTNTDNDGYVSPLKYPYNSKMTMYKMSGWQLIQDAIAGDDKLMSNFGTVVAQGNLDKAQVLGKADGGWYIDDFVDHLIDVFLTSNAWVGGVGNNRTALQNRTTFIQNYQGDLRILLGYFLEFSGPAFLGLVPKLVSAIRPQMTDITNIGLGLAFYNFYNDPTGKYQHSLKYTPLYAVYKAAGWWGKNTKDVLIDKAKSTAVEVANDMTTGFVSKQGITRDQMNAALKHATELLINLYAYELDAFESQYLGTTLRYMNTILCTHEQETVLSWIMSLDPNHMNRSYRTIEVPKNTVVELYEYRPQYSDNQYDGTIEGKGSGVRVAKCSNGEFIEIRDPNGKDVITLDQRIWVESSGDNMVIRYPSSLDIRADVKSTEDVDDLYFRVADYQTKSATEDISKEKEQYERVTGPETTYENITNETSKTNAKEINDLNNVVVPMSTRDVLHIYSKGTETYNEVGQPYSIDKDIYTNVVVEGQFIHDGDVTTFASSITDDNGDEHTLTQQEELFTYSSQYGSNLAANEEKSHLGRSFKITVPEVWNGHYVEEYFVTNASGENNARLSSDGNPYEDEDVKQGSFDFLYSREALNDQQVLELTDEVFHVFYSGTAAAPKTITKIIDFNGKMVLATQADEPTDKIEENGTFNWDNSSKNATYQLTPQKLSNKEEEVRLTSAYETADQAVIKGVFEGESDPVKKKVTVVPANNIYFNDGLSNQVLQSGSGSGFNEDAGTKYQANMDPVDADGAVAYYFTFSGTAIDVYCTTDTESGYISAAVFEGAGRDVCIRDHRIGTAKTIKNMSSTSYLSTPSLHFEPSKGFGTYTLKISVMNGANYKLDGVRVYGSTKNMEQELYGEERNATFANLREALANESEDFSFATELNSEGTADTIDMEKDVSKILFLDNATELLSTSINGDRLYNTTFEAYQKAGPKSEIFLAEDQGIVFAIKNYAELKDSNSDMKFMVGLRLPENSDSQADVLLGEESQTIKSHLDMFYEITPTADGVFTIVNKSDVLVSVTTLKTSGTEEPIEFSTDASEPSGTDTYSANALSFSVSPNTLRLAAKQMNLMPEDPSEEQMGNDSGATVEDPKESEIPDDGSPEINEPEETATPTTTPSVTPDTPAETGNTIQKVIQSITKTISSFFKSIFRR